jgi:cobalt-zinc-cadmium resistance protein CzcA
MSRLVELSIRQPWLPLLAAVAVIAIGAASFSRLRIDAVPDITTVQAQINTVTEGFTPEEIEQLVTYPIETAMAGLPDVVETRSFSRYGLSQVTVVFKDGTDVYFARQRVNERLQQAAAGLPAGLTPELGPITTALGEVFKWTVEARPGARKPDGTPYNPTDLRDIQDWIIRPQLVNLPGVTEVSSHGGFRRQFHVTPSPDRLIAYGLSFQDVIDALKANNASAGAGFIEQKGEQYLVGTTGRLRDEDDIREVVLTTRNGIPVRVADVATVGEGHELRGGAAMERGEEVVVGTALMLIGENSRIVAERAAQRLAEVNRTLPAGVLARPVYSRSKLVDATLETVRGNLIMGALLVVAVLLALLGNFVAALIVALIIPIALLFAITGMVTWGISANLLSLGAIDFGIIVDGAVVMMDNIMRRIAARQAETGRVLTREEQTTEAVAGSNEVVRPTVFGVFIIMIVYVPILTLTGIEGKMFRPMAQVVLLALSGSLLFSLTFVPAAASLALRHRLSPRDSAPMRAIQRHYDPWLERALVRRRLVLLIAAAFVVVCGLLATRLGSEFIPTLDEQDIVVVLSHIPGTGLEQTLQMEREIELAIAKFPEVATVFSQIGTADVANDPLPPSEGDVYVILKPRKQWPHPHKPKEQFIHELQEQLDEIPGNIYEFSQPIEDRFNELIAGVASDVAVRVFGDDLPTLLSAAQRVAAQLRQVRGAADVSVEQVAGLPTITIEIDHQAAARYGLTTSAIQSTVRTALAGTSAGEVIQGDRRYEIVVRLPERIRVDVRALDQLPIPIPSGVSRPAGLAFAAPAGAVASANPPASTTSSSSERFQFVPLGTVAHLKLAEGPNEISRDDGKRRVVVSANVRGRDLGGFVREAQQRVEKNVAIPPGYWIAWGGQFENLIAARKRLAVVVPLALLLIFAMLYGAFRSPIDALIVFSGVPLALTGGLLALLVRGLPFSITAAIGFIALSGVAVLNGLVMVSFIRKLRADGADLDHAIHRGSNSRLRPVLMTALVASLGFVPMAVATGIGSEVQRPLATVVIGGILSSTFLTLFVLPALYRVVHGRSAERRA